VSGCQHGTRDEAYNHRGCLCKALSLVLMVSSSEVLACLRSATDSVCTGDISFLLSLQRCIDATVRKSLFRCATMLGHSHTIKNGAVE